MTTATSGRSPTERRRDLQRVCDQAAAEFVAWRGGDARALERLVHLLTPLLWHTVRAYRLDEATAEDVVQQTWLSLVRTADGVTDPQALVRWLCVTARRAAWHELKRDGRFEATDDEVLDARADAGPTVEQVVERGHRDEALWAAVNQLSERCQRLLRVVAFADRPDYQALSSQLGMPLGSIGPTRGRCLDKLRALLGSATDWRTA